jgi:hypothetical protein
MCDARTDDNASERAAVVIEVPFTNASASRPSNDNGVSPASASASAAGTRTPSK